MGMDRPQERIDAFAKAAMAAIVGTYKDAHDVQGQKEIICKVAYEIARHMEETRAKGIPPAKLG